MKQLIDGLAARWLLKRMTPEEGEVVVVTMMQPRNRWALAVAADPGITVWYGPSPIPVTEWTRHELERWLTEHE